MSEVAIYKGPYLGDDKHYVRLDAYNEIKAQRDALASENAGLKLVLEPKQIPDEIQDLFNDTVKLDGDSDGYHEWSWVDNPDEVIIAVMNAMPKPETPTTDAYLNSVRNSFVDEAIHALAASGAQSFGDCIVALNQLRAGEPS